MRVRIILGLAFRTLKPSIIHTQKHRSQKYLTFKLWQCTIEVVHLSKNMRLKSWESPRSEGRNSKGKGGSARARQLKKQQQTLRKQLKAQRDRQNDRPNHQPNHQGKETDNSFPFFVSFCRCSIPLNIRTNRASNAIGRGLLLPGIENVLQLMKAQTESLRSFNQRQSVEYREPKQPITSGRALYRRRQQAHLVIVTNSFHRSTATTRYRANFVQFLGNSNIHKPSLKDRRSKDFFDPMFSIASDAEWRDRHLTPVAVAR